MNVVEGIMETGVVSPPNLLGEGVLGLRLGPLVVTQPFSDLRVGRGEVC